MRLIVVAGTAFVAAILGGASGAAIVVHPEWFGASRVFLVPDDDAKGGEQRRDDDWRRHVEEQRREHEKRRAEDESRRRHEGEPKPGAVTCEFALPAFKDMFPSDQDCFYARRALEYTLTSARDGAAPSTWQNGRSGTSGTVRVISTQPAGEGTYCRRFRQTVTASGKETIAVGMACFKGKRWQLLE